MTSLQFNTLFTIELLHSFFANGQCNDFIIQPSAQTAAVLRGYKMVAKQFDNKLYAGIETNASGNPSLLPAQDKPFTFFLQLSNPLFYNYTNLPSSFPDNSIYYFTNRTNDISNGKSFLSQETPFNAARTYKPGDVATSPAGTVFRAIKTNNATPVAGNDWMPVDNNRYVSEKDSLPVLPSLTTYPFSSPQSSATIEVRGFNAAAPEDYSTLLLNKTILFDNPVSSFRFNLQMLPPGKYKVKVNGDTERTVYINDEMNAAQTFAVIDLYNESTLPDGYRMLDGNTLRSPLYSLSFLNRATIWKYALTSASGTISDNSNVYHFSAPAPHIVSSLSPIPLSEKALNLKLNIGALEYTPIACASPQRLSKFITPTDVYDCSEIFLNY